MTAIRRATAADIDRCADILDHAKTYLREQNLSQWQWGYPNRANIEADIDRGELYVVCAYSGEVIGSAMITLNGETNYARPLRGCWLTDSPDDERATYACIHRIVCAPEHRGRGVATRLMEECERQARAAGKRSCRVETHNHNAGMRHVAEKLGYVHCCDIASRYDQLNGRVAYEKLLRAGDVPDRGGRIEDDLEELQALVADVWTARRATAQA